MDWQVIAAALGAAVSACGLLGIVVRSWLLPYLARELVHPVQQTHAQLTVNHHVSDPPTIRDQLDSLREQVAENTTETRALGRMYDGHLSWSQREVDRIWSELNRIKRGQTP